MRLLSASARGRRPRRRRPLPPWLGAAARWGALAGILGGLAGGAVWLDRSGWIEAARIGVVDEVLARSAAAGLTVQDVTVSGRHETSREQLVAALGIRRGEPLLGFDPAAARARVEALPWVRSARVERSFPDTVRVTLAEREPVALWQDKRRLQLIDTEGAVVAARDIRRFRDLPLLVGPDVPAHARELIGMLQADARLGGRVTAAIRVSGRRWNLRIDDLIEVRLPAEDAPAAWARLAELERRYGVLLRDIVAIDLRLPDRLVVQLAPGVEPRRAADKAT